MAIDNAALQVSLHGRRVGLTKDNALTLIDSLGNVTPALQPPLDRLTTASTAANINAYGTTVLPATGAKNYTMDGPQPGQEKILTSTVNTTDIRTVTLASGTFASTGGSTQNRASFVSALGQTLRVVAVSTLIWQVVGNVGAVSLTTA